MECCCLGFAVEEPWREVMSFDFREKLRLRSEATANGGKGD